MSKENPRIIKQAEQILDDEAKLHFGIAVDRVCNYNELRDIGVRPDETPESIIEEVNTMLPWVMEEVDFKYVLSEDGYIDMEITSD